MAKSRIRYQTVKNPYDERCQVCSGLNSVYQSTARECEAEYRSETPDDPCWGYCRRFAVKPSLEISIVDMTFLDDISIYGDRTAEASSHDLIFYLEGDYRWRTENGRDEHEAQAGDSFLLRGKDACGLSDFHAGQRLSYVNFRMCEDYFANILGSVANERIDSARCSLDGFRQGKISPSARQILHDIEDCRLSPDVKRLYLEAKTLELFAILIHETILEDTVTRISPKLSREDIVSLRKAKHILDDDIAHAPSLTHLARLTQLNEYKLKNGFRELFGTPVHAYVIDRRLETARSLLEKGDLTVTETTRRVGYGDLSRFAERFRKKYGVTPSEYRKIS